jgi:futalosine hydrolase
MNLLIVASTQFEIEPLLKDENLRKKYDVLISGVGTPSTVFHLTRHIHHHHYDLVIQAGVAGSFNNELELGETVFVKKDSFADLGAYENGSFKSLTDMDLSHELEWVVNTNGQLDQLPLKKVIGVTVNTVTDDSNIINAIAAKWNNPDIETMEGAALHYVCSHLHKPFLQLRAVSNRVGERDKGKWKLEEAIKNLNGALTMIVKQLLTK